MFVSLKKLIFAIGRLHSGVRGCFLLRLFVLFCRLQSFEYMAKSILSIILVSMLTLGTPASAMVGNALEIVENDVQAISISVSGSTVRVVGASGMVLSVYNVTGVRVMNMKIDSSDKSYELDLPKGCYILKVGKTVRKISIR